MSEEEEEQNLLREAKKLRWEDRLLHKNWKVRSEANADLASFLNNSIHDPPDLRLKQFGPLFRKTLADSNAPVQDKALDALISFLESPMPKPLEGIINGFFVVFNFQSNVIN
ncbi:hypothetical protein Scep_028487 [Stephania cephalantha]|uniref:XMAP215/Dis1/CLASP TOG domain-containing protein n=1 Tax=Stephania cephalantha TaxID=152367 RepID=A0AAP0EC61_9MAGN